MELTKLNSLLVYTAIILLPAIRGQVLCPGGGTSITLNWVDDNTSEEWSGEQDGNVQSVEIGNELLKKLIKPEALLVVPGDPPRSKITLKPAQPYLNDEVDYHNFTQFTQVWLNESLQIIFTDGQRNRCPVLLYATNKNNRNPVFNRTTDFQFTINSAWNHEIPLNFKPEDALFFTDWDREVVDDSMAIKSSDGKLTGKVTRRRSPINPTNEFDVQLFIEKPFESKTYTITPYDGELEGGPLTVTITVQEDSQFDPIFRNLEYYAKLDDMPNSGDTLKVNNLEAYDPDDKITGVTSKFEYSIADPVTFDFIAFKPETNELVFTDKVSSQLGKTVTLKLVATQASTNEKAESDLTIQFPPPKFPSVHQQSIAWPKPDETFPLDISGVPSSVTYTYTIGDTSPIPGKMEIVNGNELKFIGELKPSDVGPNNVIVFDLKVHNDGDPTVLAVVPVVIKLPRDDTTTTTTSPGTGSTDKECPSVPTDCPLTTPEFCDCSSTQPTASTDCPLTTPEPCDCPSSSTTTTPGNPVTSSECPDNPSTTCPSPECPSTTPQSCDCSSSSPTTTPECPVTTPESCDCSNSSTTTTTTGKTTECSPCPTDSSTQTTCATTPIECTPEPCECSSKPTTTNSSSTDPSGCTNQPPQTTTCAPCDPDNDPDDDDENKDDCSNTGLVVAVITTSVLCALSICGGGYCLWLLRKATMDPTRMARNSPHSVSSPTDDYSQQIGDDPPPPSSNNPEKRFSFGEKGATLNRFPTAMATPTSAVLMTPPPAEPGFSNPSFVSREEPLIAPVAAAVTFAATPDPTTPTPAKKSNIKTPKEIEPDYEEIFGENANSESNMDEETPAEKAEGKQSRVVFMPEYDEIIPIENNNVDPAVAETFDLEDGEDSERL